MQLSPPYTNAIRDTIAAVFRQPAFDRGARETLWNRFWEWVKAVTASLLGPGSGRLSTALLVAVALLLIAIMLRYAFLAYQRREQVALVRRTGGARRGRQDPWAAAQEAAARGQFTEAAHALYAALLLAVAARERLRIDPAKTIGDYARELRARSSALFTRFRDFARSYEVVIYGLGSCDRERYERLRALAAPLVVPERQA